MLVKRPALAHVDAGGVGLRINADVFTLEAVDASITRRRPQRGRDLGSQTARDSDDLVGIQTRVQLARRGTEQLSLTKRLLAFGDHADEAATQGVRRGHQQGAEHPPQHRTPLDHGREIVLDHGIQLERPDNRDHNHRGLPTAGDTARPTRSATAPAASDRSPPSAGTPTARRPTQPGEVGTAPKTRPASAPTARAQPPPPRTQAPQR